jgi:hypothetical protein
VVVEFESSRDTESYAGGSVVTGRATHTGQVKGWESDKEGYPGPPGWVLGVRLTTSHRKNQIVQKSEERVARRTYSRRPGKCLKDLRIGWQDIRILGIKNWRSAALNGEEWRTILRKARAHKGLSCQ